MTPTTAVETMQHDQVWDGRIVGGKFPLLHYLGGSKQSVVYLTEHQGRKAAIKMVDASTPAAGAHAASWKLASRLGHPHLLSLYETGLWHADDSQDMLYAVTEFGEESLAETVRERALTSAEAREMLLPTLEALRYLHGQGVLHGELRPSNIMAAGNEVKLSCDGLCQPGNVDSSWTRTAYDIPEGSVVALSSDIWSLGMTLAETLTAKLPNGANPEIPQDLPSPFDVIVRSCLNPDATRRPSVIAVRKMLDAAESVSPLELNRPVAPQPAVAAKEQPPSPTRVPAENKYAVGRNATPPLPHDEVAPSRAGSRKTMLLVAAGLVTALAIGVGIRAGHNSPATSQPTATAVAPSQPAEPTSRSETKTAAARSNHAADSAGTPLHKAMPEVAPKVRSSINGTVKVATRITVNAQGKVTQAKLLVQGPSNYFAKAALQASKDWTFTPPTRNGEAVASTWNLHFQFRKSGTNVEAERVTVASR